LARHSAKRPIPVRSGVIAALVVAIAGIGGLVAANLDAGGASAATRNLVKDPNFNGVSAAWFASRGGSLSVVAGHGGRRAVQLRNITMGSLTLALNDRINTIGSTKAGASYQASAWIRTDAPGTSVGVRMLEYKKSGVTWINRGGRTSSAWLPKTAWTFVTGSYTARTDGATIDFNVLAWGLPKGKSIFISDPSLVDISAPMSSVSTKTTFPPAPTPAATSLASVAPAPTTVDAGGIQAPTSAISQPAAGYRLVWSDDFNSIDPTKWNVRDKTWANNEESVDTARAENVFISNGALTLRAIKEAYPAGSATRQFTSGYLDTIGKASWQYGRIEMRAKLPSATGMWPAFWLRGNGGPGELDIMEAIGGMPTKTVQTIHQSTDGGQGRAGHEDVLPSGDISAWHTYAVDREPGSVTWYVDDRVVFTQTSATLPWLDSTFNEPMNIRLNLQVGGSMPAYYQQAAVAAPLGASDYIIDYVRVYQR
jgi:beta-glucanase (GH16 family)